MDLNWKLRRAKRLIEQAKEEKRDLKELVLERFSTFEEFELLQQQLEKGAQIPIANPKKRNNFAQPKIEFDDEEHRNFKIQEKQKRVKRAKRIKEQECWFCIDDYDPSLIIARGEYTALCLPSKGSLDPSHCVIIPLEHGKEMDSSARQEVRNFKKCLIRLGQKENRNYIFMETCLKNTRHLIIDCVSLPPEIDHQGTFRLAIMESDVMWTQNKKLLQVKAPKGFEYFTVEYEFDQIYTHLIEDESKFIEFGRNIVADLLGLEYNEWHGEKPSAKAAHLFKRDFDEFDWTKQIRP